MSPLKYFTKQKKVPLPDPSGALSKEVPSSAIASANKEIQKIASSSVSSELVKFGGVTWSLGPILKMKIFKIPHSQKLLPSNISHYTVTSSRGQLQVLITLCTLKIAFSICSSTLFPSLMYSFCYFTCRSYTTSIYSYVCTYSRNEGYRDTRVKLINFSTPMPSIN